MYFHLSKLFLDISFSSTVVHAGVDSFLLFRVLGTLRVRICAFRGGFAYVAVSCFGWKAGDGV